MATIVSAPVRPATSWWADARVTFMLLAVVALVLRWPDLGHPLLDADEPLYRFIGRRMAEGAIPYVDVWDRKPIGLFLIYRLIDALGGDPFATGQALALVFAFTTAATLAMMARRLGGPTAGMAAGVIYLAWIALLGGRSGQSPIFYNLPMALAAWAVLRAWENDRAWRFGIVAMLLVGVALQIKPTAVFEGVGFGLCLLTASYRRDRSLPGLARYAAVLIAAALLPTALAFVAYAALGHGQAWWFATIESIFLRTPVAGEPLFARLPGHLLVLAVPFAAAVAGLLRLPRTERWVPGGWLAAALIGVLAVPPYFNHYMLPLVAPLAMLGGIGVARSRLIAAVVATTGIGFLLLMGLPSRAATDAARAEVGHMTAAVDAYRQGGCVFTFNAPPLLNVTSGACAPTRYPFGLHLSTIRDSSAIGTDPVVEVRRILAARPAVIVNGPMPSDPFMPTIALVDRALARDYRAVATGAGVTVYARRSVGE